MQLEFPVEQSLHKFHRHEVAENHYRQDHEEQRRWGNEAEVNREWLDRILPFACTVIPNEVTKVQNPMAELGMCESNRNAPANFMLRWSLFRD